MEAPISPIGRRLMASGNPLSNCIARCPNILTHNLSFCPENSFIGQTVTFFVKYVEGDVSVFRVKLQINQDGTLLFQLHHSRSGRVTFNATLVNDGDIDYGGKNKSTVTFNIDVLPLNIRPYFEVTPSISVIENGLSPQTIDSLWTKPGFAFDINPGGGKQERSQNLTFIATQVGGVLGLFTSVPVISEDGILHLELAQDAHGEARFSVILQDDGLAGVDDSGWQRSSHNDNTSDVHFFEITVLQLNNSPVFCLPSILHLVEGSREQIFRWIPVSAGASTTNCTDPRFHAYGQELEQNLTFTVFAEGNQVSDQNSESLSCDPFDYDHDLEYVRELSWFRINASGSLDVKAVNSGRTNVTFVSKDDGGVEHGGRNTRTQILLVIVQNDNDQPFFDFIFGDIALVYEGSFVPPLVATYISSGRFERPQQLLSFVIHVIDFCVSDCPNTSLGHGNTSKDTGASLTVVKPISCFEARMVRLRWIHQMARSSSH